MTLKDKMTKQTNIAIEDIKKKKIAIARKKMREDKKVAKEWADKVIEELPLNMEKASKEGMGRVIVECCVHSNRGRLGMKIVDKWAKKEKFTTFTAGYGAYLLVIEWEKSLKGMTITIDDERIYYENN